MGDVKAFFGSEKTFDMPYIGFFSNFLFVGELCWHTVNVNRHALNQGELSRGDIVSVGHLFQ
ncbi:hypothetical protein ASG11_08050 [Sphingomonas sp. Leaf357]|nr:hypothetical protein ASG11_08050 [Sphingomonas sp. Leaf357]